MCMVSKPSVIIASGVIRATSQIDRHRVCCNTQIQKRRHQQPCNHAFFWQLLPMPINFPSKPSLPFLLKNSCKTLVHLQQLHAYIIRKGLEQNHFIVSNLLCLSTSLSYSTSIFDRLLSPSTFLFNILLKVFSQRRRFDDTLLLFLRMTRTGSSIPDKYTYPCVIKSCSFDCRFKEGEVVHGLALKSGVREDVYVGSSLVDFYGKCRDIVSARKVFDGMRMRNVVSWTALIVGYVNVGDLVSAKWVFDRMPERNSASWNAMIVGFVRVGDLIGAKKVFDGIPEKDVVSFTAMIDGYAKAGDMVSAKALFEAAPSKDVVAWSALISGYAQNGQPSEAIKAFNQMEKENVKPDEYVMVSLMSACSQFCNLELARRVDSYLSRSSIDISQQHVLAALIDMNTKCGNMNRAAKLFEAMPKRDLITYCSMIQGLSVHGCRNQALELFNRMLDEGLVPDEVAVTVILTACSRGGLVEEGLYYFVTIRDKFSIVPSPDHYACMVDLLSRAGNLKAAYDLLKSMPVESHVCAWGALLGACKLHCNVELAQIVARRLFELEPQNAGNYVLLANIYADEDRWLDVSWVRETMKERGVSKIPGRSWV